MDMTKVIYVLVYVLAIVDICFVRHALKRVDRYYARLLRKALFFAVIAIFANIMVALSFSASFAEWSYCIYFASIDGILLYLTAFCLDYTEHEETIRSLKVPAMTLMITDALLIMTNPFLHLHFDIYEKIVPSGVVFYQTSFHPLYYVHLAIDYVSIIVTVMLMVYRIFKSYDMYRMKYIMILSVLLLVVVLNILYMALSLVLDASVIFYAVAATLVYFCIARFVPKRLMSDSIGRAVNDMNEGLILFDINNECIFANAFSKKRFDITEETTSFSSEPVSSIVGALAQNGETYGRTSLYHTKKGESTSSHYQIRYNQLEDRKGRKIGSYFLIEDDTEEMNYLKQINDAKNEADSANQAKSQFLANMSHEIRTPLNAVLGMNEMILRETDDLQLLEYAGNIRTAGTALLGLINDILDFSKIEAGKTEITNSSYELHQLLRDCYNRFETLAKSKGLILDISCDPAIPSRLIGDEKHLTQVVSNLISNAVKYTREGGVYISVSSHESPDNYHTKLLISVSDTGIGISKEDIPHLFDSFRRLNEKENATIQGTGLGLSITNELVKLMGGKLSVESEPGKGSTFMLSIDQGIADHMPGGYFRTTHREQHTTYHESFRAPDAHILVVDDVEMNITVFCEFLKKLEVQIDTASGGDEAIALCKSKRYDLILLDHRMPSKDGIETFREIRGEGKNTTTPVIMLTANAIAGAEDTYMKEGFDGYLTKPVDSVELERTLDKFLPEELKKR